MPTRRCRVAHSAERLRRLADTITQIARPVTIRFRWSADELAKGHRYHFRHICRPIFRFGLHVVFAIVLLVGSTYFHVSGAWRPLSAAMVAAGVYWFAIRPFVRRWRIRRRFAKRPDKDLEVEWQIGPESLAISHDHGHSEFGWEVFFKVVRTPEGFLFYSLEEMFSWLPRHGFASDADFE